MNKYLKAVLLFLVYWIIVGTGIGVVLAFIDVFIGSKLEIIGPVIGAALGLYFAIKTIRTK